MAKEGKRRRSGSLEKTGKEKNRKRRRGDERATDETSRKDAKHTYGVDNAKKCKTMRPGSAEFAVRFAGGKEKIGRKRQQDDMFETSAKRESASDESRDQKAKTRAAADKHRKRQRVLTIAEGRDKYWSENGGMKKNENRRMHKYSMTVKQPINIEVLKTFHMKPKTDKNGVPVILNRRTAGGVRSKNRKKTH